MTRWREQAGRHIQTLIALADNSPATSDVPIYVLETLSRIAKGIDTTSAAPQEIRDFVRGASHAIGDGGREVIPDDDPVIAVLLQLSGVLPTESCG